MGTGTLISSLEGLKVIDASSVLAGPAVGTFFAELGAEVVKIEHPTRKDVTRSWKTSHEDPETPLSAYFASINYGKQYCELDLTDELDHLEFLDLIAEADVLLTNFKKGDDQKFGIADEKLLTINPRLIIGKISGYGSESDRVAYDLILQAESGFMSINGPADGAPTKMPVALIDVLAAHQLKEAILLSLYEREKTGRGRSIEVSLYEAAVSSLVNQASNYLMTGVIPTRMGSKHPNIAPYGELFNTKDGSTITFAIGSDVHFQKLCQVLNMNDIADDSRFSSNQQRVINRKDLETLITEAVILFESSELLDKLQSQNVPAGKVLNIAEVFKNPKARGMIREEEIEGVQTKRVTSIAFK